MARIVSYVHRYKRSPKKRKAVALKVPVIVRAERKLEEVSKPTAEPLPSGAKKSAVVTARNPAKLWGEPVAKDVPEPRGYEEMTARFRAVIASKLRK